MKANDRLGAIQWIEDQVVVSRLGRKPAPAEFAEYDAALEAEERAYDNVADYQPATLAQLQAKAEVLMQDAPTYMDPMHALRLMTQDIARLAGAL